MCGEDVIGGRGRGGWANERGGTRGLQISCSQGEGATRGGEVDIVRLRDLCCESHQLLTTEKEMGTGGLDTSEAYLLDVG
jgi:hypothetical protein